MEIGAIAGVSALACHKSFANDHRSLADTQATHSALNLDKLLSKLSFDAASICPIFLYLTLCDGSHDFFLSFSSHRPYASALIGHSFFKQVSNWAHVQSPWLWKLLETHHLRLHLLFQIKRRPCEALPDLLRPVSPLGSFECVRPQDPPSALASLESGLSHLDVDDWDFWQETDEDEETELWDMCLADKAAWWVNITIN